MNYIVPREWKGETAVIAAGGFSLSDVRILVDAKPRPRVIAINDAWRLVPFADVCFFADWRWWQDQQARNDWSLDKSLNFHNAIYKKFWVTLSVQFADHPQVHRLRASMQDGLDTDPAVLRTGSGSGYAAINLAYHYGVSKIILCGYDMQLQYLHDLVKPLKKARVTVINATPDSDLDCWPIKTLEEALRWKAESASSPLPV